MSSLVLFQITASMCFLYSIKVKMYKTNLIGFIVNCMFFILITIQYADISEYENLRYVSASILLVFIAAYHTYKTWKKAPTLC